MLDKSEAFSGFAVKDLDAAKEFYGGTLGLSVEREEPMGLMRLHIEGSRDILIFPTPHHFPATDTILNFPFGDIAAAVYELAAKGVTMLRYDDLPADERGITQNGPRIAWFNDPSGNILSVLQS